MEDGSIITYVIAGAPAAVAGAIAAWKSWKSEKQMRPTNGQRTADLLEDIHDDMRDLRDDVRDVRADMRHHVEVQHGRGPLWDASSGRR